MISSKKHKISQYASAESKQCVCRYCEEHFANKHQVRQHITAVHPKRHEKDFHMQCVQQPFHTTWKNIHFCVRLVELVSITHQTLKSMTILIQVKDPISVKFVPKRSKRKNIWSYMLELTLENIHKSANFVRQFFTQGISHSLYQKKKTWHHL